MGDSYDDYNIKHSLRYSKQEQDNEEDRIYQILKYCQPHIDKMWASMVVSILLDCDFRDASTYLKSYFEE